LNRDGQRLRGVQQCCIEQGQVAMLWLHQQRDFGASEDNSLRTPGAQAFNDLKKQGSGFGTDFAPA
jgi:hypothetical protein